MKVNNKTFLFSVDLEDIRFRMKNGNRYKERVPANTLVYLDFLDKHNAKATFFTVGDVAKNYPDLIKEIVLRGHEIACHSNTHIPITHLRPDEFDKDLYNNINNLISAGAKNIKGYRAPVFSLTEQTKWAYTILKKNGIIYSSSVLPASNPLFGWKDFGQELKLIEGIKELPVSIYPFLGKNIPAGGGVYFRCLPFSFIKKMFAKSSSNAVLGYFHPYDIDTKQEFFLHPDIGFNYLYNFILYFNRKNTLNRLEKIMSEGFQIRRYDNFLEI